MGFKKSITKSGIVCITCAKSNLNDELNDNNLYDRMSNILREKLYQQAFGTTQYDYIACLVAYGFIHNIGTRRDKKSLDTMINRVQKMLKEFNVIWNTDFEILYGKLNDTDFGYYLRSAKLEETL